MSDPIERSGRGLRPPHDSLIRLEQRIQSAGRFGLPLHTDPIGSERACPQCGQPRQLRETAPNAVGRQLRYWSDCACVTTQRERAIEISTQGAKALLGSRDEADLGGAYEVDQLAARGALTLEAFQSSWLPDPALYADVVRWLDDIDAASVVCGYRVGPPAALYFCGPRGRGKTHLAVGLLLAARQLGRRVAILNEKKYLHQTRSVEFGAPYETFVAEPAERAWLTLIDDIGKHQMEHANDRARVQNAWYAVIDRRYNRRRYTIFTSERTLTELVQHGTIDDSLYSRIYEMTRGIELPFTGPDQRLRGGL